MSNKKILNNNIIVTQKSTGIHHIMIRGTNETVCGVPKGDVIVYLPSNSAGFLENDYGKTYRGMGICSSCFSVLLKQEPNIIGGGELGTRFIINK